MFVNDFRSMAHLGLITVLTIFLVSTANGSSAAEEATGLDLCPSESVNVSIFCVDKSIDYLNLRFQVQLKVEVVDIVQVNQVDKTIEVDLFLITRWPDANFRLLVNQDQLLPTWYKLPKKYYNLVPRKVP